jgi:hypothetical protein
MSAAPSTTQVRPRPTWTEKNVLLRDAKGEVLYCGIGQYYVGGRPRFTDEIYMSASCQQAALVQFHQHFRHIRFSQVHVAPAIGLIVHDEHGDVLSTGGNRPAAEAAE